MRFEKLKQLFDLALDMQASHMGLSLDDIKEKLDVSHRTAQRMVRGLEDIFPQLEEVQGEDRKLRWRLPATTLDKMVTFEADEIAAIELASKILYANNKLPEMEMLQGVERKIRSLMKPDTKRRVEPDLDALLQADGLIVSPGPRLDINTDLVMTIRQAIKAGCAIKVEYIKTNGEKAEYTLHPYGFLYGHRHYLVAQNPDRDDTHMRKYVLSNIKNVELLNDYFERDEEFDLKTYSRQSFGVYMDEIYDVEWKFSQKAAKVAKDYIFHPAQTRKQNPDGTLTVKFKASGLQEMAWHLTDWGEDVEIIKPKELLSLMKDNDCTWGQLP